MSLTDSKQTRRLCGSQPPLSSSQVQARYSKAQWDAGTMGHQQHKNQEERSSRSGLIHIACTPAPFPPADPCQNKRMGRRLLQPSPLNRHQVPLQSIATRADRRGLAATLSCFSTLPKGSSCQAQRLGALRRSYKAQSRAQDRRVLYAEGLRFHPWHCQFKGSQVAGVVKDSSPGVHRRETGIQPVNHDSGKN